jgi:hypothetical protein
MGEFARPCACARCGLEYTVHGTSANPTNETQELLRFTCRCGGEVVAHIPGSVNRNLLRMEPKP